MVHFLSKSDEYLLRYGFYLCNHRSDCVENCTAVFLVVDLVGIGAISSSNLGEKIIIIVLLYCAVNHTLQIRIHYLVVIVCFFLYLVITEKITRVLNFFICLWQGSF